MFRRVSLVLAFFIVKESLSVVFSLTTSLYDLEVCFPWVELVNFDLEFARLDASAIVAPRLVILDLELNTLPFLLRVFEREE